MNNCNFIGRLTKDPELKATKSGKSVTSFCIAVNRRVKSGEQAQADYIDCVAWDKTAEIICKYFSKGSPIGINGRLQTRTYEKDGEKRKVTELMVSDFDFVGSKSSESKAETETAATQEVIDDTTATVEDTFTPSLPFEV
jgi:single-strand DNA-binding protein